MKATEPRTATYQKLTAGTLEDGSLNSLKIELCAGSMMKRPEWGMPDNFFQKDLDGKDIKIGAWTIEGEIIGTLFHIENICFMKMKN